MSDAPTHKQFRGGTDRAVSPVETLKRIRPLLAEFGITRVAHVTGLDGIGLPVVTVCRPNSRSVSVAQGKGLTREAAEASGIMEAIECYHAEHASLPLLLGSARELAVSQPLIRVDRLPRHGLSPFTLDSRLLWTPAVLLHTGSRVLVPYELVHLDFRVPLPSGSGAFIMSSNGLASGNHIQEAVSHGICELIERDANALFDASGGVARRDERRVELSTIDDADCQSVLERFRRADVEIAVWETTSDIRVPCYFATAVDTTPHRFRRMPPMTGSGCHPRRHIALLRALTEAAQGRLTVVSAAREGIRGSAYDNQASTVASDRMRQELARSAGVRSFHEAPDCNNETFDADVEYELRALAEVGLTDVAVVNLSQQRFGIAVVRVIVPGLESISEMRHYLPGPRAQRANQKAATA